VIGEVLIIGGTGFAGCHLIDRLRLLGNEPVVP
jgi:nucleoside-diphosphate-sugar epimerase